MDYDPTSLTLQPITDMQHALPLEKDWEWHLGNHPTLAGYLHSKINKPDNHYFWILHNAHPIGILGLNVHPDHNQWQTVIYLNKANQGKGLNVTIHKTLTEAFTHTGLTLIASIDVNNKPSIKSFAQMLGNQGTTVTEPKLKRTAQLHNLTEQTFNSTDSIIQNIVETIIELDLTHPQE